MEAEPLLKVTLANEVDEALLNGRRAGLLAGGGAGGADAEAEPAAFAFDADAAFVGKRWCGLRREWVADE